MKSHLLLLGIILLFNFSCNPQQKEYQKAENLSVLLQSIDQNQNLHDLNKILDNEIVVYIPDALPIYSKEAAMDLFEFLWAQNKSNSNIAYNLESKSIVENAITEKGIYNYLDENKQKKEIPYTIVGYKKHEQRIIREIIYDNAKKPIIELPKPTGKYKVGQSTKYYENTKSNRPLTFQIWYPGLEQTKENIPFQSTAEAKAISDFQGWPLFHNSFMMLMNSHSMKDINVVPNMAFPILIYNHGYGGATRVYQTVCEDLASHGYIVVSLGHKEESAYLLKEDGSVMKYSPTNAFYAKRAPEINNQAIGIEQSVILNSNNLKEIKQAYQKLVELSPLHTESVNLWCMDTKEVILKLKDINNNDKHLKGSFDFNTMGIFGHSVGGATAGELSRTTTFKAGINIDGFQFGNLIHSQLKIPFLFISSNEEGERYLRISPFAEASASETYHAIIKGFSHSSFSDLQLFSPNGAKDIELQRDLILSFFDKYLKNTEVNLPKALNKHNNLRIKKLNKSNSEE